MQKYVFVTGTVRNLISSGVIRKGAKLPSIRKLARQWGFSPITVQHAYELLVAEGAVEARARSGYYVAGPASKALPEPRAEAVRESDGDLADLALQLGAAWQLPQAAGFGGLEPDPRLLQTQGFSKVFRTTLRQLEARRAVPNPVAGNPLLRDIIARRIASRGVAVTMEDIAMTGSGLQGLDLCLEALTRPGDLVITESPNDPHLIFALRRRGLRVVELYSHPTHGVDPDQLLYLLANHRVRLVVLSPINHFPTGASSSPAMREQLGRIVEAQDVPLVEIDIHSDLTHSDIVRWPIMYYGMSSQHFLCGSFRPVLGAEFGLGWVARPSGVRALYARRFLSGQNGDDAALQSALAEHLGQGGYDKEVKRLRRRGMQRNLVGLRRLEALLPPGFQATAPTAGYMSWVRGPSSFDALAAAGSALKQGLSFAPGPLFSPSGGLPNCLGVNLSAPWVEAGPEAATRLARMLEPRAA